MANVGDTGTVGDQAYTVVQQDDPAVKSLINTMNASIAKVENPRFLQSVLAKYEVEDGIPRVPIAKVTPGCETCRAGKRPKSCYAGVRSGGFFRCLPCGRRMCSFEPRTKSSSGAWMVAANDVPLVADYIAGTSSLIWHLTKDLPASHPLVSAARRHVEQGKIILDRVREGRIGPKHKPTVIPDTSNLRPHEAIASDIAAIDEMSERVHSRARGSNSTPDGQDGQDGTDPHDDDGEVYEPDHQYSYTHASAEGEVGDVSSSTAATASLPAGAAGARSTDDRNLSPDSDEDEIDGGGKRRKTTSGRGRGRGRGRPRGRGA